MGNFYCTCTHLCSPDLMKEIAPVEGNYVDNCPGQIPYYAPPPTNLGGMGKVGHNSDICIVGKDNIMPN